MIIDNNLYLASPDANGQGQLFGYGGADNDGNYSYSVNAIDLGEVWHNVGIGTPLYVVTIITTGLAGNPSPGGGAQTLYLDFATAHSGSGSRRTLQARSLNPGNAPAGTRIVTALPVRHSSLPVSNYSYRYLRIATYRNVSGETGDVATQQTFKAISFISPHAPNTQRAARIDRNGN